MKHLICGLGEVGGGLLKVFPEWNVYDPKYGSELDAKTDVLHICFPFFNGFVKEVKRYQKITGAKLTIIHSTVPVGTSDKCGAVHSPIRGIHPNIDEGIKTFVKFFGGKQAKEAAQFFEEKGIKTLVTDSARSTELMKLWDTTQYGDLILRNREIYKSCQKYKADFNIVYTEANKTYNEGYTKLGRPEVVRPYLKYMEGKIGGHCVVNNSKLFNSETAKKLRNK